jgi:hypothetical protein
MRAGRRGGKSLSAYTGFRIISGQLALKPPLLIPDNAGVP